MDRVLEPEFHICVHLLGTFHIEIDHLPVYLPTKKIESLFAYLLLNPGNHTRDHLCAQFWGESPHEHARGSLRQALSVLRKKIHKNIILTDRGNIQLSPSIRIWVDIHIFERTARNFLVEPSFGVEPFDQRLYPDDLLVGNYDDWILPTRENYHLLYIDAMLHSVELLRARSEYTQAIVYAQHVLKTDRAIERAHQHLIPPAP